MSDVMRQDDELQLEGQDGMMDIVDLFHRCPHCGVWSLIAGGSRGNKVGDCFLQ